MAKKALTPIQKANAQLVLQAKKDKAASTHRILNGIMDAMRLPHPVTEHIFHPVRKWRLDYAWPAQKIALEVEGGIHTKGRHINPMGFKEDMLKYNSAVVLGWRIVRCEPKDLLKKSTADLIRDLHNL